MSVDSLRPITWDDYVGQDDLKRRLRIHIDAAKHALRMPEHILLAAPAGYGKTSLATIVAYELHEELEMVTMPITANALASILRSFEGILLLDEIHRASNSQQEDLLPLLEFGYVQTAGNRRVDAGALTIVGCTTERHKLIEPLVDRFPIKPTFAEYSHDELTGILVGMCHKAGVGVSHELAEALARAAAGTPRRCRQFALALRDLKDAGVADDPNVEQVLDLCGVEYDGLTTDHVNYMETLAALGGAKGLRVLCSLLRHNETYLMSLERDLIQRGYLQINASRELTRAGFQRLKQGKTECLRV